MKRLLTVIVCLIVAGIGVIMMILSARGKLEAAPRSVTAVKEIVIVYDQHLAPLFNSLTPQERIFIYYMTRASLPGNIIAADQSHRDAVVIQRLFEYLLVHQDDSCLRQIDAFDVQQFLNEVRTYLIYLWTNHSQYFSKENAQEKRTPARIGLPLITKENLITTLESLAYSDARAVVETIASSLFDLAVEPTMTVPDDIAKSAVNFYSSDFTNQDFGALDANAQTILNAYFYIEKQDGKRQPRYEKYGVEGKYAKELRVAVYWLQKALDHARKYPAQFDEHLIKSLEYLIAYLTSGDEGFFKKHSIAWLKSNSKVDYCFGWIETYHDPKGYRAIFQSDITIKSLDIDTLNKALPAIEGKLPLPNEFKRDNLMTGGATLPNASINVKAFTGGSLGPLNITLAYCLPNYEEIRSTYGSKQIIYHAEKPLGELLNPELYKRLFNSPTHFVWFEQHDPENKLMQDISMLETILHETLGHGSGKLTKHTFVAGEPLTVEGKTYKVGDTISVTSSNIRQLLVGRDQTIEELRAEIIALLASITCYDEFAQLGMLSEWPKKIDKRKMIELSILSMVRTGLHRLITQADDATEIAGDHARANTTIMNYLIDKGAVTISGDNVTYKGLSYTIFDSKVLDIDRAIAAITELANLVQRIKSTGDGLKATWLIDTYGRPIRNVEHMRIMKKNMKAVKGEVKVSATLYPQYEPIYRAQGEIIDIKATWPKNIAEQYLRFKEVAYKTD